MQTNFSFAIQKGKNVCVKAHDGFNRIIYKHIQVFIEQNEKNKKNQVNNKIVSVYSKRSLTK